MWRSGWVGVERMAWKRAWQFSQYIYNFIILPFFNHANVSYIQKWNITKMERSIAQIAYRQTDLTML